MDKNHNETPGEENVSKSKAPSDIEIRLKALELSDHGMGVDLNYAKRIEIFIKSGEIKTISELQRMEEEGS